MHTSLACLFREDFLTIILNIHNTLRCCLQVSATEPQRRKSKTWTSHTKGELYSLGMQCAWNQLRLTLYRVAQKECNDFDP